ncbi:RidA family protein [Streptomyces cinereospinus]|uniref:RidA family protein n=1 Tax=Streptomyces cinereospinus TaxID=285561 RepID=A0ABV5N719_9ACTN
MRVNSFRGRAYDEVFATCELPAAPGTGDLSGALDRFHRRTGGTPLNAVVFGTLGARPGTLPGVPAIYAGDQYPRDTPAAALELRGIVPTGPGVTVDTSWPGAVTVRADGTTRLLCAVHRAAGTSFVRQATDAFETVAEALARAGLTPRHIGRTWYFISDIDVHYDDFNTVRNTYFDAWGLTRYPASTGIGAALPGDALISVLVEATDADDGEFGTFDTGLQCPPVSYGPRFVRANESLANGLRTVNVSGISSVTRDGSSLSGDLGALVDHTMRSFFDLLATTGMTPPDIASAYVYCKGDEVRAAFERYARERGLGFPRLVNHVDVCRPDLVLEIEARAVRPAAPTESPS